MISTVGVKLLEQVWNFCLFGLVSSNKLSGHLITSILTYVDSLIPYLAQLSRLSHFKEHFCILWTSQEVGQFAHISFSAF